MKIAIDIDVRTVVRWLLGVLFVWASLSKIANPQEFYVDLAAYQLPLSAMLMHATAIVLPWVEFLCGLLMLANTRLNAALIWILLLSLVFTIATAQAWARGLHIACGCLDFRVIGVSKESSLAKFLESPAFAFFRALLIGAAAAWLFSHRLQNPKEQFGPAAARL